MRTLSCVLLTVLALVSSAQNQSFNLSTAAPPPVPVAGAITINPSTTQGTQTLYYWVVTRYPSGSSIPYGPAIVTNTPGVGNLTASTFVQISWASVPGATGYDVVTAATPNYPAPCAACAVVLNTTSTTVNDTGAALLAYPPSGLGVAQAANANFSINNRDYSSAKITVGLNAANYLMGLISGTPTSGMCAQFNSDGTLSSTAAACAAGGGGSYVPYTGATSNVVLGAHSLSTTTGLDAGGAPAATGLKAPVAAGAAPLLDGQLAVDSTSHALVYGSNGATQRVVGGGATLNNVGFMPYVSGNTGILGIDTSGGYFWDSTNHVGGLGTAAPSTLGTSLMSFVQTSAGAETDPLLVANLSSTTGTIAGLRLASSAAPTSNGNGVSKILSTRNAAGDTTLSVYAAPGSAGATALVTQFNGLDKTEQRTDIATPAAPTAGTTKIYTKGGAACALSPAGVETCTQASGGSTPNTLAGTYATISSTACAAGNSGQLALITTGYYQYARCNGTSWVYYRDGIAQTIFTDGDYTWNSAGAFTTSSTNGAVVLTMPDEGSATMRAKFKNLPAAPYTITLTVVPSIVRATNQSTTCGLFMTDGTKIMFNGTTGGNTADSFIQVAKWNNLTSYNTATNSYVLWTPPVAYVRVVVTAGAPGTTTWQFSVDGVTWRDVLSENTGTFMTQTQFGYGGYNVSGLAQSCAFAGLVVQ